MCVARVCLCVIISRYSSLLKKTFIYLNILTINRFFLQFFFNAYYIKYIQYLHLKKYLYHLARQVCAIRSLLTSILCDSSENACICFSQKSCCLAFFLEPGLSHHTYVPVLSQCLRMHIACIYSLQSELTCALVHEPRLRTLTFTLCVCLNRYLCVRVH